MLASSQQLQQGRVLIVESSFYGAECSAVSSLCLGWLLPLEKLLPGNKSSLSPYFKCTDGTVAAVVVWDVGTPCFHFPRLIQYNSVSCIHRAAVINLQQGQSVTNLILITIIFI